MRILVVTNLYPPHAYGGYEDLCAGAVAAWRAHGHEVQVLTSTWLRDDVPDDAAPPDGEVVHRELPIYWDEHRLLRPPTSICYRWERRTRVVMSDVLDRWRPDVVSVWNAAALPFGMFAYVDRHDLPAVLVIGDRWLEWGLHVDPWASWFSSGIGRIAAPIVTAATGLSTRVNSLGSLAIGCFASEHLRRRARDRAPWHLDASVLVPHGVDLGRYPPVPLPEDRRPWSGRLLYVGRVAAEKGIDTAVRALAHLAEATLDVIGTGDREYARALERLVASLGLAGRVRFQGEARPSQLIEAYDEADALVFPSRWPEPFGIVPLEAMTRATPVLASGTGGSGEYLIDGLTAVRFDVEDPGSLAAAVQRLADDRGLHLRLARNGLEAVRWLSRERCYDDLEAWHLQAAEVEDGSPPGDRPLLPPSLLDLPAEPR